MKTKKPSWIDIKKSTRKLENYQLIDLLKDLYQLSEENKAFLHARFITGKDSLERYKKVILDSISR
jgi:hypothetical protein